MAARLPSPLARSTAPGRVTMEIFPWWPRAVPLLGLVKLEVVEPRQRQMDSVLLEQKSSYITAFT